MPTNWNFASLLMVIAATSLIGCLLPTVNCQTLRLTLNFTDIAQWVNKISTDLDTFRSNTLGVSNLESSFKLNSVRGELVNDSKANETLQAVRSRIQALMWNREKQVEAIRIQAETSFANYSNTTLTCSSYTDYPYYRAIASVKRDNSTPAPTVPPGTDYCSQNASLDLSLDPRLYDVETTRTATTAHVPQYVYDASSDILNAANWTNSLSGVMKSNADSDQTLQWQYFGTTTGLMRIYPGVRWSPQLTGAQQKDAPRDNFDCRIQNWYELSASYPRDLIVVIDGSGSMKGSKSIMANMTLTELLNSLTTNDYFNVLMAIGKDNSGNVSYVSSAYNGTLVQATDKNKNKIIELINEDAQMPFTLRMLAEQGVAELGASLTEAFQLLRLAKNSTIPSAGGVQAIALIVDSIWEDYAWLFQKYNADDQVRLFTFLTGLEASDADVVRGIACGNRGYFGQIATLSDVRESVLRTIPINARGNSATRKRFFTWSDVHQNQMQVLNMFDRANFTLYTSVAQVAYDLRTSLKVAGDMIGVAGVDVSVDEFERLGPAWQLGPLGYIFIVTNNGFVVYHPELRTIDSSNNPAIYYGSRDIADLEYPIEFSPKFNSPDYNLPLRLGLINGLNGAYTMNRIRMYHDNTRTQTLQYQYFVSSLSSTSPSGNETRSTPFSLGIALPWQSGQQFPQRLSYPAIASSGLTPASLTNIGIACPQAAFSVNGSRYGTAMANFEFCDFPQALRILYNSSALCALATVLNYNSSVQSAIRCSADFLGRAYLDAVSTQGVNSTWPTAIAIEPAVSLGAKGGLLFLWTGGSGLFRWFADPASPRGPIDPTFVTQRVRNGTRDPLYERTVAMATNPDLTAVLTSPSSDAVAANAAANLTYPRAFPVYLTSPVRLDNATVAAVAGAELDYAKLEDYFARATNTCSTSPNCTTCSLLNVRCYLLDTNGIVIISETRQDVGKTFDQVSCDAVSALVRQNVFYTVQVYDFQSVCTRKLAIGSSASSLFSPIKMLIQLVTWALIEGFLILSDLYTSFFSVIRAEAQQGATRNLTIVASRLTTGCQTYKLLQANATTLASGTRVLNASCDFSVVSPISCLSDVYVSPVPKTNLIFVAVVQEGFCSCQGCDPPVGSADLSSPVNFSLLQPPRRKPPWTAPNIVLTDNSTLCTNGAAYSTGEAMQIILAGLSILILTTACPFGGLNPS